MINSHYLDIFPVYLWIATPNEKDYCQNNFLLVDDENEFIPIDDSCFDPEKKEGITIPVVSKNGMFGCLILILRPNEVKDYLFVHEASHFVDWCNDYLGLECNDFYSGEARAYLNEWTFRKLQLFYDRLNQEKYDEKSE